MQSNIVKFLLTGLPRTGTTLIGCALLDHLEVLYYGELLHILADRRAKEAKGLLFGLDPAYRHKPPYEDYEVRMCDMDEDGYQYLNDFYSREVPYKAIGFKILYTQAREGANSSAWEFLEQHPEIKIINMQRENLLDVIVSVGRAERSYLWHTNRKVALREFRLSIENMENVFNMFERLRNDVQTCFQSHQVLNINYSDINFQDTASSIFSFLEVKADVKMKPKLEKIATVPPNEELINYPELKEYFKNTRFGKYFIY